MAEQEAEQTANLSQDGAPKKSSNRIFLIIGLAVAVLAGGGGLLFSRRAKAATSHKEEASAKEEAPAKEEVKSILHLETFTVNMNDPEQKAFLRIGIDLGLGSAPKGESKGPSPTALVRDTILSVLMATKPEDVTGEDGKKQLKERLLQALEERAPELQVQEVYFNEFLMQR